jgi:hypothetical protein
VLDNQPLPGLTFPLVDDAEDLSAGEVLAAAEQVVESDPARIQFGPAAQHSLHRETLPSPSLLAPGRGKRHIPLEERFDSSESKWHKCHGQPVHVRTAMNDASMILRIPTIPNEIVH